MEQDTNYNLLFRWFVGLPMDAEVWHPTVFTHNRDRLLEAEVAHLLPGGAVGAATGEEAVVEQSTSRSMAR